MKKEVAFGQILFFVYALDLWLTYKKLAII